MSLTLDQALKLIDHARGAGAAQGLSVAAAVVDAGGRLIACARGDGVGYVHTAVAERKAATAVNFKAPTHALLEMLKADPVALAAVMSETTLCALPGGFPIVVEGVLIGGFGVAGAHYSQDQAIGERAIAAP